MSILSDYRATRAVESLLDVDDPESPGAIKAVQSLREIGAPALPKLIEGLSKARHPELLEELLLELLDAERLPVYCQALLGSDEAVARGVARVLARSEGLSARPLLDLFSEPEAPYGLLVEILRQHPGALRPAALLRLAGRLEGRAVPAVFRLLRLVVTDAEEAELLRRLESDDPDLRLEIVRTLGGIDSPEARGGLVRALMADPQRAVRLAALEALLGLEGGPPIEPLCQLLRDPDMIVRNRVIETLPGLVSEEGVPRLVAMLEDASEDVRRAVVEVLNGVGSAASVPGLLGALNDTDWWVRTRAADTLGSIGGSEVLSGVLPLFRETDEGIRQNAVDILRRIKDERVFQCLVAALGDNATMIREGAVDALAAIEGAAGDRPLPVLEGGGAMSEVIVDALGVLGDARAIPTLVAQLESGDPAVRRKAFEALEQLADESNVIPVIEAMERVAEATEQVEVKAQTEAAIQRLSQKSLERRAAIASPTTPVTAENAVLDLGASLERPSGGLDPLALRRGEVLADRYRVVRHVGRGGFGVVMLVVDEMIQEQLVLKFLSPQIAGQASAVERFKHELRYARRITHENVIRIYDIITFGQSLAISMEYFASHSLAQELGAGRPLDLRRGIAVLRAICSGLAEAHKVKVIHRDLKPANILIDDDDRVKIVDFGLAAAASHGASRITKSGLLIGTPHYMAPEQIRGREIDARTDVYSLGIVMYEVFTGRVPYKGSDSMSILFQHFEGEAPPPRELNPEIPEALEAIILQTMAIDPGERVQSVSELNRLLAEVEAPS